MRTTIAILVLVCGCAGDPVQHLPDAPPAGDDATMPDAPIGGRTCTTTPPPGIGPDGGCAWAFSCDDGHAYTLSCAIDTVGFACVCRQDGADTGTPLTAVPNACMPATDMCTLANDGCDFALPISCPQ